MPPTRSSLGSQARSVAALLAVLALALLCRSTGYGAIFAGGRVNLLGADSHYHTLRLRSQARVWPRLDSQHDHHIAHPEGYDVIWPPGFDYLAATLLRAAGVGAADVDGAARLGTYWVVALGCLAALVVALLARQLGLSLLWALLAGLAAAALPIAVEYSRLGRVDHHVAETLFTLLVPLLYLRAVASRRPWAGQVAVGVVLGVSFWLWPSALLDVGLWVAVLLLLAWWRQSAVEARNVAMQLAVCLVLLLPLAAHMPASLRWRLAAPSWAQLWLLALALLAALGLYLSASRWPGTDARTLRRGRLRGLLLPGLLAASLPFSPFASAFVQLWSFGAKKQLWGLLLEQRSLFSLPLGEQLLLGTYLVYALIPLALLALLALRRGRQPGVTLLTAFGLPLLALGLFQLRFLATGALLVLPLAALGLAEVGRWLQEQKGAGRWVTAALAGTWLLALQPALPFALTERSLPEAGRLAREELARWLGRHTRTPERPSTGAQSLAREGVFTPINMGQLTANLANLPVVGSTVIVEGTLAANRDTMAFYSASDLEKAAELAQRRQIRWVLVTRFPRRRYQRFRRLLGWPVLAGTKLMQAHRRSLAIRLLIDFGARASAGPAQLPPLAWLQHRHESALQGPIPAAQLYRRVASARLVGRARPGASVQLYLPLLTNRGRPFVYRVDITAAADGRFELRLPYATTPATRELTGTRGPLRLRADGREVQLKVDQSAVERGSIVTVPALTPAPIPDGSPPSTAPTKAAPSAPSAL